MFSEVTNTQTKYKLVLEDSTYLIAILVKTKA